MKKLSMISLLLSAFLLFSTSHAESSNSYRYGSGSISTSAAVRITVNIPAKTYLAISSQGKIYYRHNTSTINVSKTQLQIPKQHKDGTYSLETRSIYTVTTF